VEGTAKQAGGEGKGKLGIRQDPQNVKVQEKHGSLGADARLPQRISQKRTRSVGHTRRLMQTSYYDSRRRYYSSTCPEDVDAGALAGIILGCIFGGLFFCVLCFFCLRACAQNRVAPEEAPVEQPQDGVEMAPVDTAPITGVAISWDGSTEGKTAEEVAALIFAEVDKDGTGKLGRDELRAYVKANLFSERLRELNPQGLTRWQDFLSIIEQYDSNEDDMIDINEWTAFCRANFRVQNFGPAPAATTIIATEVVTGGGYANATLLKHDDPAPNYQPGYKEQPVAVASIDGLPPGWATAVDPGSGGTYYYNATTGATTWDRPTQ